MNLPEEKKEAIELVHPQESPEKASSRNKGFTIIEPKDQSAPQEIKQQNIIDCKNIDDDLDRVIDSKTIANANCLKITILEGSVLKPGTILKINAGGLIGSGRKAKDGFVYFGTEDVTVSNSI